MRIYKLNVLRSMSDMKTDTKQMNMKEFLDAVGRKKFQDETGHSMQVVSRAVKNGLMPAHWFYGVREFCRANDFVAPEHLFQWSHPSPPNKLTKQNAN